MLSTKRCGFNRYEPPSPSLAEDEDIEESFLKDMNKMHDILPQPFRRIDKLLTEIYEVAWEEIEKRDSEKVHKQPAKVNLHKVIYEEELLVKESVKCIAVSAPFLFLGSTNKITVYKLPDLMVICDWLIDESNTCVSIVKDIYIIAQVHNSVLLIAVDEKGHLTILGFKTDMFLLTETLNTLDNTGVLNIAEKIYLSEDGTFLAVSWKDCSKTWLDVYKLPKDLWFSELATLKAAKEDESESAEEEEVSQVDFHKVIPQFKLHPPEVKVSTVPLSALMRNFDAESAFIGSGVHHCLSSTFFKNLTDEFKSKCNLPEAIDLLKRTDCKPKVHFLKGQLTSSLFPTRSHMDSFNGMAVWWENSNQLSFFLLKQCRDQPEPFSVLPHSENIKLSCINSQTNLLATYIANGYITIWNRYFGYPVKVFFPGGDQEITMFDFSTVYHGEVQNRLTYATANGKIWQVTCERSDIGTPVCLDDRSDNDGFISAVQSPNNLLTLIWSSGQIVIYDEIASSALCQLEIFYDDVPNGHELHAAYTEKYIIVMREESSENEGHSRFFLFQVEDSPILQPFIHCDDLKTDEDEKEDSLNSYYLRFVDKCNSDQNALYTRVKSRYRRINQNVT